jgi:hypothetical protein
MKNSLLPMWSAEIGSEVLPVEAAEEPEKRPEIKKERRKVR